MSQEATTEALPLVGAHEAAVATALGAINAAMARAWRRWERDTGKAAHPQATYLTRVLERCDSVRDTDLAEAVAEARARLPEEPMVEFAAVCAEGLPDFLSGRRPGVQIVFPRGSLAMWNRVQRDSRIMRPFSVRGAKALLELARPGARVLEIGGGTGAATTEVFKDPRAAQFAEYMFTDTSAGFVNHAIKTFAATPGFRGGLYDIDCDPDKQGLKAASCDLIIGVNVVHVSIDPRAAVSRLRSLLRPGGRLVLSEGAPPPDDHVWASETLFAFLPQWAASPSQQARLSGFYDRETWSGWCADAGLDVETPAWASDLYAADGGVILARRPA